LLSVVVSLLSQQWAFANQYLNYSTKKSEEKT